MLRRRQRAARSGHGQDAQLAPAICRGFSVIISTVPDRWDEVVTLLGATITVVISSAREGRRGVGVEGREPCGILVFLTIDLKGYPPFVTHLKKTERLKKGNT